MVAKDGLPRARAPAAVVDDLYALGGGTPVERAAGRKGAGRMVPAVRRGDGTVDRGGNAGRRKGEGVSAGGRRGETDEEAIRRLASAETYTAPGRKTREACRRCGEGGRPKGENYCEDCRGKVLAEIRRRHAERWHVRTMQGFLDQ